jgi:hypothetical protein
MKNPPILADFSQGAFRFEHASRGLKSIIKTLNSRPLLLRPYLN